MMKNKLSFLCLAGAALALVPAGVLAGRELPKPLSSTLTANSKILCDQLVRNQYELPLPEMQRHDLAPKEYEVVAVALTEAVRNADLAKRNGVSASDGHALLANREVMETLISQYMRAREGYQGSSTTHNYYDYNLVRINTDPRALVEYMDAMRATNPKSPAIRLGQRGVREVSVVSVDVDMSVAYHQDGEALKYFIVKANISEKGGTKGKATQQIRTFRLQAGFVPRDMAEADRCLNPLQFIVRSYKEEILPTMK